MRDYSKYLLFTIVSITKFQEWVDVEGVNSHFPVKPYYSCGLVGVVTITPIILQLLPKTLLWLASQKKHFPFDAVLSTFFIQVLKKRGQKVCQY